MKIHRFVGNFNLKIGVLKIEDWDLFNQAKNVLKLKAGEKIVLGDGNMNEGTAEILEYGKNFIRVSINEIKTNENEPSQNVVLYCAILKKENFELVAQKATEVGIKEIVPIITERTVKLDIRKDRLEKIIKEAAEQSGRGIVPVLREPIKFQEAFVLAKTYGLNLFFDQSGESFKGLQRLDNKGRIGAWVGPEGGWDSQEVELALKSGFKIINLGELTLRTETAAIIGAYLAIHKL